MRTLEDVNLIKLCIHAAIRKMIVDMQYGYDYEDTLIEHKIKDYETLLVIDIVQEFKPLRHLIQNKMGFTYLSERRQYEYIVLNYSNEPGFYEFMYQMHLKVYARYIDQELKYGIL